MAAPDWGYSDVNGPATWAQNFPQAAGSKQSPVDIRTDEVKNAADVAPPLVATYDGCQGTMIVNTGYGWKVEVNGNGTVLKGGPLEGEYRLVQFHSHWGNCSDRGSEHTVDGRSFAGELHLVHWNCSKYATFEEAVCKEDGLAVLGVFLKPNTKSDEVEKVVSLLPQVAHRGETSTWTTDIDIQSLLPISRAYWTYQGSLTTPPCNESVTWIVFKEPIEVSEEQLNSFRQLSCKGKGDECEALTDNYRPPLPLGNRELRECGN